jgi:HAD superfamily hydrolase (TIGR01459 family)
MPIEILKNLTEVINKYEIFILSLYGIIFDNRKIYPASLQFLKYLSKAGKTVVLFSNTEQRLKEAMEDLEKSSIFPPLYQHLITAGEESYRHLFSQEDPRHASLGRNCYFLGAPHEVKFLQGLNFKKAFSMDEADFILAYSTHFSKDLLTEKKQLLKQAARKNLPLICVNPDTWIWVLQRFEAGPGFLAKYYEQLGGEVYYNGKPHSPIYQKLFEELAPFDPTQTLVIGDSLETDILGASNNQLDSLYIPTPLITKELKITLKKTSLEEIRDILSKKDYYPTYMMKELTL